jgi:hypothetical protein
MPAPQAMRRSRAAGLTWDAFVDIARSVGPPTATGERTSSCVRLEMARESQAAYGEPGIGTMRSGATA